VLAHSVCSAQRLVCSGSRRKVRVMVQGHVEVLVHVRVRWCWLSPERGWEIVGAREVRAPERVRAADTHDPAARTRCWPCLSSSKSLAGAVYPSRAWVRVVEPASACAPATSTAPAPGLSPASATTYSTPTAAAPAARAQARRAFSDLLLLCAALRARLLRSDDERLPVRVEGGLEPLRRPPMSPALPTALAVWVRQQR
jgi:hypothetical protein